jgi:hypothetical protein
MLVKDKNSVLLRNSVSHRKLLFDRGSGDAGRSLNKFAVQSGWKGENRISLRDGFATSELCDLDSQVLMG